MRRPHCLRDVGGRIRARGERGRTIHDQDRVEVVACLHDVQRRGVTRAVGVANDVDGVGSRPRFRQTGVECRKRLRGHRSEPSAEIDQTIDSQHAKAAAIGEDPDALALQSGAARERFRGGEQFLQIQHSQQSRTTEGGVIDGIGPCERAGMRQGGSGGCAMTAGLDNDDWLCPRCSAGRGKELTSVGYRFDVEEDCVGPIIEREMIQAIAKIHIDLVADRDNAGKANLSMIGPFDQRGDDCARLRDDREIARARGLGEEARIEARAGRKDADTVGPNDAQSAGPGCASHVFCQRTLAMAEPGRNDDCCCRPDCTGLLYDFHDAFRRNGDDNKIGRRCEFQQALATFQSVDLGMGRVDQRWWIGWIGAPQIGENGMAQRTGARTRTHEGDGSRREKLVQTIVAHRLRHPVMDGAVIERRRAQYPRHQIAEAANRLRASRFTPSRSSGRQAPCPGVVTPSLRRAQRGDVSVKHPNLLLGEFLARHISGVGNTIVRRLQECPELVRSGFAPSRDFKEGTRVQVRRLTCGRLRGHGVARRTDLPRQILSRARIARFIGVC